MKKCITIILLFSTICSADVQHDSIQLNAGQVAPFTGYLLPPDKVLQFRSDEIDLDFYKKTNGNLNLEITDYQTRVKNYQDENAELAKQVASSDNFFSKAGYFVLGALITGLVSYGVYKTK